MKKFVAQNGPFLKSKNKTSNMMNLLLLSLLPIILFAQFKNGILPFLEQKTDIYGMLKPIWMILSSGLVAYATEWILSKMMWKNNKEYMKNSYAIIPGIFLALILPLNTPLSLLYIGDIIAIGIGKMVYGGFGHNIFNPALIGRLFIITAYAVVIDQAGGYLNPLEVDTISSATPLSTQVETITYDNTVAPFGNLTDFFIGTIPGSLGETSALLCLLAFLFLAYHKVIKTIIPIIYIGTVFFITFLIAIGNDLGIWYPFYQILSGGLFFGAIFMATDPVTSPTTKTGQVLYGLGLGILTVSFRFLTPAPEGVLTSILTMNMFVFLCDKIGNKAKRSKKYNSSIGILFLLAILLGTTISLNQEKTTDTFQIIDKKINGSTVSYTVSEKGYGGLIKANITIQNGVVTKYTIQEHHETFYQKVEEENYISQLLEHQNENIDTVSGATITSSALKRMIQKTLEDYQKSNIPTDDSIPEIEKPILEEKVKIINQETIDGVEYYTVKSKSFGGDIILKIAKQNTIQSIEVLEQHDSYFSKIIDQDYLTTVTENASHLKEIDTVSGATISSNAIKEAIKVVLEGGNYEE